MPKMTRYFLTARKRFRAAERVPVEFVVSAIGKETTVVFVHGGGRQYLQMTREEAKALAVGILTELAKDRDTLDVLQAVLAKR